MTPRLLAAVALAACAVAGAQTPGNIDPLAPNAARPLNKRAGPAAAAPAIKLPSRPEWEELSDAQQEALAPLASSWPGIDEQHKRKWLAISRNFSALPAQEQVRMHDRMKDWTALSPQERAQARLNYAGVREVPADKRAEKWEAYQSLPFEQRQHLAATAQGKPTGAATALKPVSPKKLTATPATAGGAAGKPAHPPLPDSVRPPKIETGSTQIHPKTLLPITAPAHPRQP